MPAQTVRGARWQRNSRSAIPITHWTGQSLGPPLPVSVPVCISQVHLQKQLESFQQKLGRIILSFSWFTLFSWKSAWKRPCSRLPEQHRLSQTMLSWQTGHPGYWHERGLFLTRDILSPSPPKEKCDELFFPKPIVCFRTFVFMKANVTSTR